MSSVRSEFGLNKVEGDIGIEIEVEGNNLPHRPGAGWRVDHDGSLRGEAFEYVFDGPATLEDTRNRLALLGKAYKKNETEVNESVRAGVHVHINVQGLSMLELANFMTLYLILEDLLVRYCGPHREGNLFCLRTQDAEYAQFQWIKAFQTHQWQLLGDENLRYASMNVCSLGKYGSLEFRAMRGTRDLDLIGDWAEILLSLREKAKTFKTPMDIVGEYSERQVGGFIDHVLGRWAYIFKGYEGWEDLTLASMRRAQLFAFCRDWPSLEMDMPKIEMRIDKAFPVPDADHEELHWEGEEDEEVEDDHWDD